MKVVADEFNKYLSYVRNLGFEDTPDYDYLRDLFTQALKNTGEVEDGEYDWMKLNNGKGWEVMKHHSSQLLHAPNQMPNPSNKALGGGADTPRGPQPVTPLRLNAAQPLPPSQKPGTKRGGAGGPGVAPLKRQSGVGAGLMDTTGSTQGQFQNSTVNLPGQRMSQANPNMKQPSNAQQSSRPQNAEPQSSTFSKILKALCCSR